MCQRPLSTGQPDAELFPITRINSQDVSGTGNAMIRKLASAVFLNGSGGRAETRAGFLLDPISTTDRYGFPVFSDHERYLTISNLTTQALQVRGVL